MKQNETIFFEDNFRKLKQSLTSLYEITFKGNKQNYTK